MKERIAWLDNARFIAIALMIMGHVCGHLLQGEVIGVDIYQNVIVAFNMPLFVILSGYGNYGSLSRMQSLSDFGKIVWKSFTHVLCPIVLPMLLYCSIDKSWEPIGFEKGFWFLWMLFYLLVFNAVAFGVVRILSSFCKKYLQYENENMALLSSLFVMMAMAMVWDRQYTCEMCSYFAVGFLARHYKIFEGTLKNWWCIALIALLSVVMYSYWYDMQSGHWFYWNSLRQMKAASLLHHYALRQLIATGFSFVIIMVTIRLSRYRSFISLLGMHTLSMYIVQDFFMRYQFFYIAPMGKWLGWIQIFGVVLCIVILSLLIALPLSKFHRLFRNFYNFCN